jgi:hypothetical protein
LQLDWREIRGRVPDGAAAKGDAEAKLHEFIQLERKELEKESENWREVGLMAKAWQ